jgi:hypothetical protein
VIETSPSSPKTAKPRPATRAGSITRVHWKVRDAQLKYEGPAPGAGPTKRLWKSRAAHRIQSRRCLKAFSISQIRGARAGSRRCCTDTLPVSGGV